MFWPAPFLHKLRGYFINYLQINRGPSTVLWPLPAVSCLFRLATNLPRNSASPSFKAIWITRQMQNIRKTYVPYVYTYIIKRKCWLCVSEGLAHAHPNYTMAVYEQSALIPTLTLSLKPGSGSRPNPPLTPLWSWTKDRPEILHCLICCILCLPFNQ